MENKCIFFFKRSTERKKECLLISSYLYTTSNHFFEGEKKNDIFTKKNHEPLHVYCNICDKNLELAETKKWENSAISGWPEKIKLRNGFIRMFPPNVDFSLYFNERQKSKYLFWTFFFRNFSALSKKCVHACLKMQCLICLLHLK